MGGLLSLAAFRLLLLGVLPLDLCGDEAYYWEWGKHLDWGYFSKPPGIAWLMAVAGFVGGDTTFGIRLFAVLMGTAGLWLFYCLGRQMYDARTGLIVALIFALTPANAALNLILTIDAPLMLCWSGALLSFWRLLQTQGRSVGWSLAFALFLAGGLLSKQMMMLFYPLIFITLAVCSEYRGLLKSLWFWLALILSLAALLPPLYWNLQNDWVTVTHTLHHFETGSPTLLKRLARFLEFSAAGLGLLTPVVCVLMVALLVTAIFGWKKLGSRERFLWIFSGPGLLVMMLLTFRQRVNPNWPAVFLPGALLLMTAWSSGRWSFGYHWVESWRKAFRPGLKLAFVIFCFLYILLIVFSFEWIQSPKLNPLQRIRGWRILAGEIAAVHAALPDREQTLFITQGHRFIASELAFYLPRHPRVYRFHPDPDRIESQHDLWESPAAFLNHDAIIVVYGEQAVFNTDLAKRFEEVTVLKELIPSPAPGKNYRVGLFLGRNLRAWPEPARSSAAFKAE